ncbi:hypothetical protein Tco_0660722 [Tanacetum coccineum]
MTPNLVLVKTNGTPQQGSIEDISYSWQCKQPWVKCRPRSLMFKRRLITADQASVFMAMMSDHNSSDLAPQRQETSVENVSSGLVPQGQKASDYDNSDSCPKQMLFYIKRQIHATTGWNFFFSQYLEEY